jgi:hypothetical protein
MSMSRRLAVSIPAGLLGLGLFTATSQEGFNDILSDSFDVAVELDEEGLQTGELVVSLQDLPIAEDREGWEIRVRVQNSDAKRSLDVMDPDATERAERVRDGIDFVRSLETSCPDAGACEASFDVRFEGHNNSDHNATFTVSVGSWRGFGEVDPGPTMLSEWIAQ